MKPTKEQVAAGQAVYTRNTLYGYDLFVLGLSNRFLWRCPTSSLLRHYENHLSSNHLDVGVGTGYFPDRCRFPSPSPRLALMDLNPAALEFAARRVSRYHPETYRQNILEPIADPIAKFDSVGLNYLLHCLPGDLTEKTIVFDHLKALMNPGATIFGSTILQGEVSRNWPAKQLMKIYNQKGIFSNSSDHREDLEEALQVRFVEVSITVVGCVALFSGRQK